MKVKPPQRKKVVYYLKEFYKHYPQEKYTVFHFVKYLKLRLKNNKDAWIGVSGDTGCGKSLFVIMCQILFGRPFDLTKNITYIPRGEEIIQKFLALKFNTLCIDEAAKQMRAVQWQDKSQQQVNIAAMTERFLNNAVFLNMPNFNEFTKSMRTGSILFRAIIPYRTKTFARVIIQRRSRNWRSDDPWSDKLANTRYDNLEKKRKEITNDIILNIERGMPNTIMDFIVPNLSLILPEVTKEYEKLKQESRGIQQQKDQQEGKGKSTFYKNKYEKIMTKMAKVLYNNELDIGITRVTKSQVAEAMGVGMDTFNRYLRKESKDRPTVHENK